MNRRETLDIFAKEVEDIKADGLYKGEIPLASPQGAGVTTRDGKKLLNMCANNYLGLGDDPEVIEAAKAAYDDRGYGLASVRFICGTQDIHKQLESIARSRGVLPKKLLNEMIEQAYHDLVATRQNSQIDSR